MGAIVFVEIINFHCSLVTVESHLATQYQVMSVSDEPNESHIQLNSSHRETPAHSYSHIVPHSHINDVYSIVIIPVFRIVVCHAFQIQFNLRVINFLHNNNNRMGASYPQEDVKINRLKVSLLFKYMYY